MKEYDKNKESSYLHNQDINNLKDEGCFLDVDIQYPENLHNLHNDLPFLPERIKTEKFKKLVADLHDKTENVIHIKSLKEALNHGLVFGKTT